MAFTSQADAKFAGFFSRKNKDGDAHANARETYKAGVDARFYGPKERLKKRAKLSAAEQLTELDNRCGGKGQGAKKERARLAKLIK